MFEAGSSFSSVINKTEAGKMALRIKRAFPAFKASCFLEEIELDGLKISERTRLIASALERYLPDNFEKSAAILAKSLPPKITVKQTGKTVPAQFIVMPMAEYIARRGLEKQFFSTAMNTLKLMTCSFSSEFAVRPFLEKYPVDTLKYLAKCSLDDNVDVYRIL